MQMVAGPNPVRPSQPFYYARLEYWKILVTLVRLVYPIEIDAEELIKENSRHTLVFGKVLVPVQYAKRNRASDK
jgi:hypothetical protein